MGNHCQQQQQPEDDIKIYTPGKAIEPPVQNEPQVPKPPEEPIKPQKPIVDESKIKESEERSAVAIQCAFRNKVARQKVNEEKQMLEEDKPKDWTQFDEEFKIPTLPDVAYRKINNQISNEYRMLPTYIKDGTIYKGQWKRGVQFGYGQMLRSDSTYLEGQWRNGILEDGAIYFPNKDLYLGTEQIGVRIYHNGVQYSGDCLDRLPHGKGVEEHPDGTIYDGEFHKGQKHGKGLIKFADKSEYNGEYVHGEIEGQGTFKWPDGTHYVGQWKKSMMNGNGKLHLPDGVEYEGQFHDDLMEGYGIMTYPDKSRYEGHFRNNKREGKGSVTTCDKVVTECDWEDGKLMINPEQSHK
ncbi:unnamed protein product (macronuclear) [Paramecium tetraurelia]|uniref:MORN repeat protein n=1 Tax=Paramecium tetraurelia TaxID=5888 RepID=A0DYC8_PARTE|nr:uncharacterized protein GSPATT00003013001 [Paramecium tetraurelia]CAK88045.1 unnamed protein product [Paramecium tetraurelia]|eukprot:XP_001455442.1 hypothetical protein (macronuclear) [Paramecium tetraurelia strain d4-2]